MAQPTDWVPLATGGADLRQQVALISGERVRLTTKERDLLAYLVKHGARTVTRQDLVVHVWGHPARASQEPVYSAVKRLRAKIDRGEHQHIVSVHGDGYRWSPAPEATATDGVEAAPDLHAEPIASPSTGFFGRAEELAAIRAALAEGARLVTLVGPGGAGKTRCALEIGSTRAHVFCDLSVATSEASVVALVAAALEIPLEGTELAAWTRGIGRALAAAPGRLVVLDNVETHIDLVASLVAKWLPLAPTLLATSREPLRVRGERVVNVGPLAVGDAAMLFSDRVAMAGAPAVEAELTRSIVDRIDRLPLAIELAAAQLPELGARALLEGLAAQLETLVDGARDAPARHATLRAAVEWSFARLGEAERSALCDLGVFAGSFTFDAGRAVVATLNAAALLAGFSRRSLIRHEADRFVFYAAVRELAHERGGERAAAEIRHARHFVEIGEAACALLDGAGHRDVALELVTETAELLRAWERSIARDVEVAARLALVLDRALGLQATQADVRRHIISTSRVALGDAERSNEPIAKLLFAEGRIAGAPAELLDDALARTKDQATSAEIRLAKGERLAVKDLVAARAELTAALELATAANAETIRARILSMLGEVAWAEGRVAEASSALSAALRLHTVLGDQRSIARASALLAHVDRLETGGGRAAVLLARARTAADELGEPLVSARVWMDLGQHLARTGNQDGARVALNEAALLFESVGFARERAFLDLHVAETLVGIGDFDAALDRARTAHDGLPDGEDIGRSTIHEAIACIYLLRGELFAAADFIESGLAIAIAQGASRSECTLLGKRGLLHLASGDPARAWRDFDEAAKKNEARGAVTITAAGLADRAMAAWALGNDADAEGDLSRARTLLHDPPADSLDGRMLAVCRAAGRGYGATRAGAPGDVARAAARAELAPIFEHVRPAEWDVVLRIADWLVQQIGA